jgi:hypothetical protein
LLGVWLLLSAITLSQLGVGSIEGEAAITPNAMVSCSAIAIALLKVRIIFREFMEVRHAPARLGRLTDAWVLLTGVILIGAYFVGTALAKG